MNDKGNIQTTLETLQKILRAEANCGFQNSGVIGGLDKMVPLWEAQAHKSRVSKGVAIEVSTLLGKYPLMSIDERETVVRNLSKTLKLAAKSDRPSRETQPIEQNRGIPESQLSLDSPLTMINGIGPRQAERLKNMGLERIRDAVYFYPHRYLDYSALKPISRLQYGEEVTVIGTIRETRLHKAKGGRIKIVRSLIGDGTGEIECSWFNQAWLQKQLRVGLQVQVSGRADMYLGKLVFANPEWDEIDQNALHTGRIVPVHKLTKGIGSKGMRRLMHTIIQSSLPYIHDPVPRELRERLDLSGLQDALYQVHFPKSQEGLNEARRRLAFDELLILQLGMLRQRSEWQAIPARSFEVGDEWRRDVFASLPFVLTDAQQSALDDVFRDVIRDIPMNRLLQGDVGSGKTVIAALVLAVAVRSGFQGALMAPTSVLAEQHYRSVCSLIEAMPGLGLGENKLSSIRLLQGSTPDTERDEIANGLLNGSVKLLIGTHSLIQGSVEIANLGVVVVDEQQRFGVAQRAALRAKGTNPHLLVMTATPIPRSLALTVYGDLDVSILDELPPGRQTVETRVLYPDERERAYSFVRSQVDNGRQAFMIYPLVEENSGSHVRGAVDEYSRLQEDVFPDLRLGLLHGRIKPAEKDLVMEAFRSGELDILVATSVIEVGVDVPNASVMFIESANRFGLAQLHQFRGRVGRGEHKSFCLLVSDMREVREDLFEKKSNKRLRLMETVSDGFSLAEKDMELRGPGEFLGTRQAGHVPLQMASLTDIRLVNSARREADRLFSRDPDFADPEHHLLGDMVDNSWSSGTGDVS